MHAKTKRFSRLVFPLSFALAAAALPGCKKEEAPPEPEETMPADPAPAEAAAPEPEPEEPEEPEEEMPTMAMAELAGKKVKGKVEFTAEEGGVKITGTVEGLSPGKHGFHIHETGECKEHDFKSAGGHFTGGVDTHGAPDAPEHHAGDFGNIEAAKDGKATIDYTDSTITLEEGGETGIVGRAVIVHAAKDDMKSQPSGNAGARAACGVITASNM